MEYYGPGLSELSLADRATLANMAPAMQMRIKFKIQGADGKPCDQEIHNTIHRVPGQTAAK